MSDVFRALKVGMSFADFENPEIAGAFYRLIDSLEGDIFSNYEPSESTVEAMEKLDTAIEAYEDERIEDGAKDDDSDSEDDSDDDVDDDDTDDDTDDDEDEDDDSLDIYEDDDDDKDIDDGDDPVESTKDGKGGSNASGVTT